MSGIAVRIAGLGLVTPGGRGPRPFWDGLLAGRVALGDGRRFRTPEAVGEVPETALGAVPPGQSRKRALLDTALGDALRDADLSKGGGAGAVSAVPDGTLLIVVGQSPAVGPEAPDGCEEFADTGPHPEGATVVHLSHACASALFGVALARDALRAGMARYAVVAGASALNPFEYSSMTAVRAVATAPARPFDQDRAGISVGEGSGAVVLEAVAGHEVRPQDVLVTGAVSRVGGASPAASDSGTALDCMADALAQAGRDRPDYLHAHATATKQGDAAELRAAATLAEGTRKQNGRRPASFPVSSHKGAIGHLLHASGFAGIAAAVCTLRTGVVPPTPGLVHPDPELEGSDPDSPVLLPRRALFGADPSCVLVNAFGFGGNNASLALGHPTQNRTAS
ncbi:beta-ketoacyl-ACP synthase II [Streptomyces pseudoechinosporeus]